MVYENKKSAIHPQPNPSGSGWGLLAPMIIVGIILSFFVVLSIGISYTLKINTLDLHSIRVMTDDHSEFLNNYVTDINPPTYFMIANSVWYFVQNPFLLRLLNILFLLLSVVVLFNIFKTLYSEQLPDFLLMLSCIMLIIPGIFAGILRIRSDILTIFVFLLVFYSFITKHYNYFFVYTVLGVLINYVVLIFVFPLVVLYAFDKTVLLRKKIIMFLCFVVLMIFLAIIIIPQTQHFKTFKVPADNINLYSINSVVHQIIVCAYRVFNSFFVSLESLSSLQHYLFITTILVLLFCVIAGIISLIKMKDYFLIKYFIICTIVLMGCSIINFPKLGARHIMIIIPMIILFFGAYKKFYNYVILLFLLLACLLFTLVTIEKQNVIMENYINQSDYISSDICFYTNYYNIPAKDFATGEYCDKNITYNKGLVKTKDWCDNIGRLKSGSIIYLPAMPDCNNLTENNGTIYEKK